MSAFIISEAEVDDNANGKGLHRCAGRSFMTVLLFIPIGLLASVLTLALLEFLTHRPVE